MALPVGIFVQYKTKIKKFADFIIFLLLINLPLGTEVTHNIWARSAQRFQRLLDTNKQTGTQTDRQNIYINIDEYKDNNVKNAELLKKREYLF